VGVCVRACACVRAYVLVLTVFVLFLLCIFILFMLLFNFVIYVLLLVCHVLFCIFFLHCANSHSSATLTEVFPCFFLSCKANARV
jgi:hypothetical protein